MQVNHPFVSAIADDSTAVAAGQVVPSNWNANHSLAMAASQRVAGRNTAGAGAVEEVTASQIFDWVSNTNGVLLTRIAGTWGAVANIGTDNGDLVATENTAPVAPAAGKVKIFGSSSGGRQMIAALAPAGDKMNLQPFWGQKNIIYNVPLGPGSALLTSVGPTIGASVGTATNAGVPTTTNLYTSISRKVFVISAAGAGSAAGWRTTQNHLWRGNAARLGGFHLVWRFGVGDAVATARMFVGVQPTAVPTDVDPDTLTNLIGVGCNASDTVMQLYASGAAAQARTSLGANFPVNTNSVDVYEIAIYCAPNSATITWQLTRLNTGDVASGTISAGANLPANTSFLAPMAWRSNGGTAAAVTLALMGCYGETDY